MSRTALRPQLDRFPPSSRPPFPFNCHPLTSLHPHFPQREVGRGNENEAGMARRAAYRSLWLWFLMDSAAYGSPPALLPTHFHEKLVVGRGRGGGTFLFLLGFSFLGFPLLWTVPPVLQHRRRPHSLIYGTGGVQIRVAHAALPRRPHLHIFIAYSSEEAVVRRRVVNRCQALSRRELGKGYCLFTSLRFYHESVPSSASPFHHELVEAEWQTPPLSLRRSRQRGYGRRPFFVSKHTRTPFSPASLSNPGYAGSTFLTGMHVLKKTNIFYHTELLLSNQSHPSAGALSQKHVESDLCSGY